MFSRLFGGQKGKNDDKANRPADSASDLPEAIAKSRDAIRVLEKRQEHLENKIKVQREEAKQRAVAGDKRSALLALKRAKLYEKDLEQCGNAHLTLEQQIISLESAQAQRLAVGALAAGVSAQKAFGLEMNVTKVDDLVEDLQEQASRQNEIAAILAQGAAAVTDDEELLAELEQLEARQLDEALADAASVPVGLPRITTDGLPTKTPKESDEDQLADLLHDLNIAK